MKPLATLSTLGGIAASCLALTCSLVAGPAQSKSTRAEGTWSTKAPLLTQRTEVAVAELDGKIYVLGGTALGKTASQLNQEYDPATDRWRDRAPIPQGTSHAGVAGYNGKIYVIGGFTANVHVGHSIKFSNTMSRPTPGGNFRRSAARAARSARP
jgi:Kelch motif protein